MLINQGKYYPKAAINGGFILMAFGVLSSLENAYVGIPFLIIGIYLSFTYGGIEIDSDKKRFRDYTIYFGFRKGDKWKDLDKYPDLCILKTRESTTTHARSNMSVTYKESYFDLFLLSSNHRNKVFVERFEDKDSAFIKARELEKALQKELKAYKPIGSKKV